MFIENHLSEITRHLEVYRSIEFNHACEALVRTHAIGAWVYIGGNGGSQSIAEHFSVDWNKGVRELTGLPLKSYVLNSSSPGLTAISNDISYQESLSFPLEGLAESRDVLLLVSSSGKSPNILKAIEKANQKKMTSILISGFGRKSVSSNATIELNIDSTDYQVIEDVHSVFGHLVLKHFAKLFE